MNLIYQYNSVKSKMDSGQRQTACELAKSVDTRGVRDASEHIKWAEVMEELELYDLMVRELNLALRDDPLNEDTCYRLSEAFLDQGNMDRAAGCLLALMKRKPGTVEVYKRAGRVFEEAEDYDKAIKIYRLGLKKTGDDSFKPLIRSLEFVEPEEEEYESEEQGEQILPARHNLVTFTTLFAGREGVYARQWGSPTGSTGYTPVREPFTLKVAENHILGNHTVGIYPMRLDNTVNFIAIDLDLPKFVVNKAIRQESQWKKSMERLHRVACRIIDIGAEHGIPVYLEDSGFKGRHCWIFLETPVPASVAKKLGDFFIECLDEKSPEVSIELFPKQSRVKRGGLGNLIKLPLGFHKKTGKRSLFMNPDGTPVKQQLKHLDGIERVKRGRVFDLVMQYKSRARKDDIPFDEEPVREYPPKDEPGMAPERKVRRAPQRETETFDFDRDPEVQYLMLKCPVIRSIVEKVNREAAIGKQEAIVLIHSMGHLRHGPDAVNHLFKKCINSDPDLFLKSRIRGNPVSCPKIRARVPDITSKVDCNCRFDMSSNMYPTPLIHIHNMKEEQKSRPLGMTVDSMQFQNLLHEYLRLKKQAREIGILIKKYETQLHDYFDHAGMDVMNTPMGRLKLMKNENGEPSFTLEFN